MLPAQTPWSQDPAWSSLPEEKGREYHPRIAYSAHDGEPQASTIHVWDMDTNQEAVWGGGQKGLMRPVWLGEESLLIAALQDQLETMGGPEAQAWAAIHPNPANTLLAIGLRMDSAGGLSTDIFVVTPEHALPLPSKVMPSVGSYAEWNPAMHPGGSKVAFESNDGGDRELFVLSYKGALDVSNHHAGDWNPVWSPKGDWLAFESFRSGRRGIYRVNTDTALAYPIAVHADSDCWGPSWSPDGAWMAYASDENGASAVYVSHSNGQEPRRLLDASGPVYAPAWRPRSKP